MSKRQQMRAYIAQIFDVAADPSELLRAQSYVGEDGTFTAIKLDPVTYQLYVHDEVTPGGFLLGGGGGGPPHVPSALTVGGDNYTLSHNNGDGTIRTFHHGSLSGVYGNPLYRDVVGGIHSKADRLVYQGQVADNQVMFSGWNRMRMLTHYDPEGRWALLGGVQQYVGEPGHNYQMVYTFTEYDFPAWDIQRVGTIYPSFNRLAFTVPPNEFSHTLITNFNAGVTGGQPTMWLYNGGAGFTIDYASMPSLAAGGWSLSIYETKVT